MIHPIGNTAEDELTELEQLVFTQMQGDEAAFINPERGWHEAYPVEGLPSLNYLRSSGISLVLLEANLKKFLSGAITVQKLAEIKKAFDIARKANVAVIFRAAYDFDGKKKCEPKDLGSIISHIAQLKDVFYQNEDILYTIQAGFLGPWGEWHNSTFGDPPSLEAQNRVVNALLDAAPARVSIQIRRPMFIRALIQANDYNEQQQARIAYHNDAFLSSKDDYGTYVEKNFDRAKELAWIDQYAKHIPVVAETTESMKLSDADNAVYEMHKLHIQSLNSEWHPDVIKKWKKQLFGKVNAFDYITAYQGYRFQVHTVGFSKTVKKGAFVCLYLEVENKGFGNLLKNKNIEIVLKNGNSKYIAKLADNPQEWYKENGRMEKTYYLSIPREIVTGIWQVYLHMPSAYDSLHNNPAYAVRFANANMWDSKQGYNLLGSITISELYQGVSAAQQFQQITREQASRYLE